MSYFINEAKNMPSGQGRKLNLKSEQIYPVLCHLLLAVMCYEAWMPLIVFLWNKCATSGGGKRMQLLPLI